MLITVTLYLQCDGDDGNVDRKDRQARPVHRPINLHTQDEGVKQAKI
jgi:hypothetical protein